jgi:hypothetical protein
MVKISGLLKKRAKKFCLELHSGSNIALRMNAVFRFASKVLVFNWFIENIANKSFLSQKLSCNSRTGDVWGQEERIKPAEFPFKRKKTFDLLIYCEEEQFIFYVDDCLVGKFNHRIGPSTIDRWVRNMYLHITYD